jgi:hypothetical protein
MIEAKTYPNPKKGIKPFFDNLGTGIYVSNKW